MNRFYTVFSLSLLSCITLFAMKITQDAPGNRLFTHQDITDIASLDLSPNGAQLIASYKGINKGPGMVRKIINSPEYSLYRAPYAPWFRSVRYSKDGSLIVGGGAGVLIVKSSDLKRGFLFNLPYIHYMNVDSIQNGEKIIATTYSGISIYCSNTGKEIAKLTDDEIDGSGRALYVWPDEQKVAFGGNGKGVFIFDIQSKKLVSKLSDPKKSHYYYYSMVGIDESCIATGHLHSTIHVRDTRSGQGMVIKSNNQDELISGLQIHPKKQYLLAASNTHSIKLWDLRKNVTSCLAQIPRYAHFGAFVFTLDGKTIIGSNKGDLVQWDIEGEVVYGKKIQITNKARL